MEGFGPEERNSFEEPTRVAPVNKTMELDGDVFRYTLPGNSMAVFCFHRGCEKL